jgi:hypothetical protein
MSPIATLIVLALAAAVWFGVLRPRLRGRASKKGGDGGRGAIPDGQRDRHDGDAADGDGSGGGDGGGD